MKVIVLNHDELVRAKVIPADARTISPSPPHYLLAIAAVGAVLVGTALLYGAAWRAGRVTAAHRARRDAATDSRTMLSAAMAVVAQHIIDLDQRYGGPVVPAARRPGRRRDATGASDSAAEYQRLCTAYTDLFGDVAAADRRGEVDVSRYTARAEALAARLRALSSGSTGSPAPHGDPVG